jgi:Mechanosensitive ion channel, conserved TM helix
MDNKPLESVRDVMSNVVGYLPTLLAGLIVLLLGAIAAWVVSKLVVRILIFLRLDRVIVRLGWGRALDKGDVRHSLFGILGVLAGLLLFLIFLDNAVVIWKLSVLSKLLEKLVQLVPQLITAGIILLIGWGVANAVARAVHRAMIQEEFDRARLVSRIVRSAILVVACAIALVELQVAVAIVTGAFLITFGALALSFVFAFGLGSKRAVEKMWEEHMQQRKERREKEAEESAEK